MSAFILFHGQDSTLVDKAKSAFSFRGFRGERLFETSAGTLLLYPKQNVAENNYYLYENCTVYCVGTVVYKGLSYGDSLKNLAVDFSNGVLETDKLRGSFVVLFDKDFQVSIMTDKTRMYRLFTDQRKAFLSSSLLVAASLNLVKINEDAVVEQLLCGYVGGGQTLVQNVSDVSFELSNIDWVKEIGSTTIYEKESKNGGNAEYRAKVNANVLHDYLQDVKAISSQYGAECGLSGGCDSRLVFSSVNVDCVPMKSVHTHQTSNIHNKEIEVVKQLSHLYNIPLTIIPTTFLPSFDGDIDEVLKENVLYFDARNAGNIGAMSQTHTRLYKKQTSGDASVTFSGIGGEIYRNFYFTNLPIFNVAGWFESRIFEPGTWRLFPVKTYKDAVRRISAKISQRAKIRFGKCAFLNMPKRYFDSYRIPYALGNVVNANNQMSFYLAPFTEQCFIEEAKKDRRLQDHSGKYEGKILMQFDPKAAMIETSRGFTLSNIPFSVMFKWKLMGMFPAFVWRFYEKRQRNDPKRKEAYASLKSRSPYFCEALSYFQSLFPDWSYQIADEGSIPLNSFVFTVCAVYELSKMNGNNEII